MFEVAAVLIALPVALLLYTYVGYPALLAALASRPAADSSSSAEWPRVSVSLPAHNEEATIRNTLEAWLAVDYPRDRLQIVVISDASTDRTDEIVREYEDRGVQLLRLEQRGGKTAAEDAAAPHLTGEIIVNTDASVHVLPDAMKPLVRAFEDPTVGVASGRDVSVGSALSAENVDEGRYVGYEMWVRRLETRSGGIIGASGCFYAILPQLHRVPIRISLSRDFASALIARERGYRSVSVDGAVCLVPRTDSLRAELRRKIRTMSRGLETLWYKRSLLNPFRYGLFAWKLISHKLFRWLVPVVLPLALVGLVILSFESRLAVVVLGLALLGLVAGAAGLLWPENAWRPRIVTVSAFLLAANLAAVIGWTLALTGRPKQVFWEPTRRPVLNRTGRRLRQKTE